MVLFPNAKINIGLEILRKRPDNYHDLETVFYPIQLSDVLEINKSHEFEFATSGIQVGNSTDNLVVKAYQLLQSEYNLPAVKIHLLKCIPMGAGLGGGSSDAAFTLVGLNELFELGLSKKELIAYASKLGSDCPFFIINQPSFAEGRGEILSECELNLSGYKLILIKPECSVPTAIAYSKVKPVFPKESLLGLVKKSINEWPGKVENRFEDSVFPSYPQIKEIKEKLYSKGAVYTSMSGSGSSVFGIFRADNYSLREEFPNCFYWEEVIR